MGFYQTRTPYTVLIAHQDEHDITYVDDAGNLFTKPKAEFHMEYVRCPDPDDAAVYHERAAEALEQRTKEVSAPEVAGDASAPEKDTTLPG